MVESRASPGGQSDHDALDDEAAWGGAGEGGDQIRQLVSGQPLLMDGRVGPGFKRLDRVDGVPPARLREGHLMPSTADERWVAETFRTLIQSACDFVTAVAQLLAVRGLEPDVRSDVVDFLFLGHLHRVELEDLEARLERCRVTEDQAAMLAAGLPIA
jgi:hypothetical protein